MQEMQKHHKQEAAAAAAVKKIQDNEDKEEASSDSALLTITSVLLPCLLTACMCACANAPSRCASSIHLPCTPITRSGGVQAPLHTCVRAMAPSCAVLCISSMHAALCVCARR